MPRIFISYRRGDSAGHAGRLCDDLIRRFGSENLVMDLISIEPGRPYHDALVDALRRSDRVLVVIGPSWAGLRPDGTRRIDDDSDVLRLEVRTALNSNALVIPVLVNGGVLPSVEELPADIAQLAMRQSIEISDARWGFDVERLSMALDRRARWFRFREWTPRQVALWCAASFGAGIFLLALIVLAWLWLGGDPLMLGRDKAWQADEVLANKWEPPMFPRDNGCGLSNSQIDTMREPFFLLLSPESVQAGIRAIRNGDRFEFVDGANASWGFHVMRLPRMTLTQPAAGGGEMTYDIAFVAFDRAGVTVTYRRTLLGFWPTCSTVVGTP